MDKRFIRNIPAITPEEQRLLQEKRVVILGCGGLGGYVCEYLSRLGLGKLRVVDSDSFDESNLNRQLLCTAHTLGQHKADAAKQRVTDIAPHTEVESLPLRFTQDNAWELLEGCAVAVDALDNVESRLLLEQACHQANIPLVHGAIQAWSAQAAVVPPGSGLLQRLYAAARPDTSPAVLPFTAALCAAVQAAETTKLLCGRESSLWGKLWLWDGLSSESETIKLI